MLSWSFFLTKLLEAYPVLGRDPRDGLPFVIVHDRQKGSIAAQTETLPFTLHSFCLQHLKANIATYFGCIPEGLHKAATSPHEAVFNDFLELIETQRISKKPNKSQLHSQYLHEYLLQSEPSNWATSKFRSPRFGSTTSNAAESFNASMKEERAFSYLRLVMSWIERIAAKLFKKAQRYQAEAQMDLMFSQVVLKRIEKLSLASRCLERIMTDESSFIIKINDDIHTVNLSLRECSCKLFTEY